MGLFDAAKNFVTDPENIARAKALLTDQNVDAAAAKLRELAPEQARGAVDGLAEKAKEWGGPEDENPAATTETDGENPAAGSEGEGENPVATPEGKGESPAATPKGEG